MSKSPLDNKSGAGAPPYPQTTPSLDNELFCEFCARMTPHQDGICQEHKQPGYNPADHFTTKGWNAIGKLPPLSDNELRDTVEDYTHYNRTCTGCGHNWWGLHCPHDGYQNPCPNCGKLPKTIFTFSGDCTCEFVMNVSDAKVLIQKAREEAEIDALSKLLPLNKWLHGEEAELARRIITRIAYLKEKKRLREVSNND